jgi:hypothetical protein
MNADKTQVAPKPIASFPWRLPDVHQHTPEMRAVLRAELRDLVGQSAEALRPTADAALDDAVRKINAALLGDPAYPDMQQAVQTMRGRVNARDPELGGLSPTGLLSIVVDLVNDIEDCMGPISKDGPWHALKNTMLDMGGTCLQGHTHRLLALYVALRRDRMST